MNMLTRFLVLSVLVLFWLGNSATAATVQQPTYYLLGKDVEAQVSKAVSKSLATNDVNVKINGVRSEDAVASANEALASEVDGMELDKVRSTWQAVLYIKQGEKNLAPVRLNGHYEELAEVPVLKRRMEHGELIKKEDIDFDKQPAQRLRRMIVTDSAYLIGKSPKRMISAGRVIRQDEVGYPTLVNKGSNVTLVYKSSNLEIKTVAEALENGAKGDVIKLKNLASKSVVQGTIETASRVRVNTSESTTAEVTQ